MIPTALLLALCAAPAAQAPASQPDEVVRLRDGRLLVGEILDHDLDGFRLELARTGGRFRLAWTDLFPGEAERMRAALGYATSSAVPMVAAHRILLRNGAEMVGRIVRQDARGIELRTLENSVLIPPGMIAAPPEPLTVEATSVLTPEQYYLERLPDVDEASGLAQYQFAQELEQVFALERAQERYAAAGALAGADQALATRVALAQKALAETLANRAEAQALEAIQRAMYRERFEDAEDLLAEFEQTFPAPKLRGKLADLRRKFAEDRDEAVARYLARNWFNRAMAEVKRRALDREAPMDELLAWVDGELPQLVRAELVEGLKSMNDELQAEDLPPLWAKRVEQGAARHRASFGEGTWILGKDRAQAGMVEEKDPDESDGKSDAQREMEEKVQRYLKNLEAQRRSSAGAETGEATGDDWWRQASVSERTQFLLAYYAEYSGDFEITSLEFTACSTCAGSGILESIEVSAQGAVPRKQTCPICHGVAVRRSLNFR